MSVDAYVTRQHYWHHVRPIWDALPSAMRGVSYDEHTRMDSRAMSSVVLCAGYDDAMFMQDIGKEVIYVEHGAGQAYKGVDLGNYSGGAGFERRTKLFICPSETVADRWRNRYPSIPAVAVGCPKMDRYIGQPFPAEPGAIGITFHWSPQVPVCPEAGSAFMHYQEGLHELVKLCEDRCIPLLAHAHPRWDDPQSGGQRGFMKSFWRDLDVEYTPFESDIFERCSVLVADNTSLMYEFASLNRPVITLDAPWYRRDVDHGLRFWSHAPEPRCDNLDVLLDEVSTYIDIVDFCAWPPPCNLRYNLVPYVYSSIDGHASERAVEAIQEVLGG